MDMYKFNRYLDKLKRYQDQGRYDKVLKYTEKLINMGVNEAGFWNLRGFAFSNMGQNEEAIPCYDRSLNIDSNLPVVWQNKGDSLIALGRFQGAIKCYDKSLEINPTNTFALNQKGVVLFNLGRFKEAVECYNEALELDPPNNVILENKNNALNAIQNESRGDFNSEEDAIFNEIHGEKPNIVKMEDQRDIYGLITALRHSDVFTRRNATKALGRLNDERAIDSLERVLKDDQDRLVRKHAENALSKFTMTCTECNHENEFKAVFCQECGNNLKEVKPDYYCSNCGYENTADANFCSNCGEKLENTSESLPDHHDKIDINNDSEEKISCLPNIGPILAKKAINIRESKDGFESVEDFCFSMELKPHVAKNISTIITCGPIRKPKKPDTSGRVVDF